MNEQIPFFSLLFTAIIISRTRLKYPFLWMETFFHELSHGLICMLTLGRIHRIELKFNGAGCCTTSGGMRIPILLAGYLGASTWGTLIYLAGWSLNDSGDIRLLNFLLGILILTTVFWVRNLTTLFIIATMFIVFALPTEIPQAGYAGYAVQFFGLYVLQSSITAPLHLIDGQHVGDGADLQRATLILPEGLWILLWFTYALACLYFIYTTTAA